MEPVTLTPTDPVAPGADRPPAAGQHSVAGAHSATGSHSTTGLHSAARPSRVSGAATRWVADQLAGPPRTGKVLHVGRDATYVDLDGTCLGVLSRSATHVPCGIRTAFPALVGLPGPGRASIGDAVVVGEGRMSFAGTDVSVSRLVDASTPAIAPTAGQVERLARAMPWPTVRDELPGTALDTLRAGDPAAVAQLVGRGGGLTPLGDDVLCGWIATAGALGRADRAAVAARVATLASRTTLLSATLLDCALRGDVLPQFRRLLLALTPGASDHDPGLMLSDLVRVGHTSGAGLAAGCLLALDPALAHDLGSAHQTTDEGTSR